MFVFQFANTVKTSKQQPNNRKAVSSKQCIDDELWCLRNECYSQMRVIFTYLQLCCRDYTRITVNGMKHLNWSRRGGEKKNALVRTWRIPPTKVDMKWLTLNQLFQCQHHRGVRVSNNRRAGCVTRMLPRCYQTQNTNSCCDPGIGAAMTLHHVAFHVLSYSLSDLPQILVSNVLFMKLTPITI